MAKSVSLDPLSLGGNPAVLDGLRPENPLVNTIGGMVASLFALLAVPATVVTRYPRTGSGELRRIYLLDPASYAPGSTAVEDLQDALGAIDGNAAIMVLQAENTGFASKAYGMTGVAQAASISGAGLGAEGSFTRTVQDEILLPEVPKFTLASALNRLEDVILVNSDVETVVIVSQTDGKIRVVRGDFTQAAVEGALEIEAALAMENYTPASSAVDRHFFEAGALLSVEA